MKEKNIKRINKLGKIAKVLTRIAMVCSIIGGIFMMVAGGFLISLPKDAIRIEGTTNASVYITGISEIWDTVMNADGTIEIDDAVEISGESVEVRDYLKLYITDIDVEEDTTCFHLSSNLAEDFNLDGAKTELILECFGNALSMIALAVGLGFASALSKALETCETPFSEDIVKRMKKFCFSMIPYAVLGGINGVAVIVLLLMIFVFSYGCSIQAENDDIV